jgi:serine phosphatase RsbU (regulator of sigma subunit)
MEIQISISKIDRYGEGNSGDTVEVVERPNGGISIVMADGQKDGKDRKSISTMACHKVIEQISNGVLDGAAIRTTSNWIFSEHEGHIQADVIVISVDTQSNTILISRNNPVPIFLINHGNVDCLLSDSEPIGGRTGITPSIIELPIEPNLAIVAFSDGIYQAGGQIAQSADICTTLGALFDEQEPTAQEMADFLLSRSIRLDDRRPKDDMSVIALLVSPQSTDNIRRMSASFSIND